MGGGGGRDRGGGLDGVRLGDGLTAEVPEDVRVPQLHQYLGEVGGSAGPRTGIGGVEWRALGMHQCVNQHLREARRRGRVRARGSEGGRPACLVYASLSLPPLIPHQPPGCIKGMIRSVYNFRRDNTWQRISFAFSLFYKFRRFYFIRGAKRCFCLGDFPPQNKLESKP